MLSLYFSLCFPFCLSVCVVEFYCFVFNLFLHYFRKDHIIIFFFQVGGSFCVFQITICLYIQFSSSSTLTPSPTTVMTQWTFELENSFIQSNSVCSVISFFKMSILIMLHASSLDKLKSHFDLPLFIPFSSLILFFHIPSLWKDIIVCFLFHSSTELGTKTSQQHELGICICDRLQNSFFWFLT